MKQDITKEIKIASDVNVDVNDSRVSVIGPLGKIEKDLSYESISIEKRDNSIVISAKKATKREKKMIGTIAAHIRNMIDGVMRGFQYKLQICSVHFPISVSLDASKKFVVIKNFIGETKERKSEILENVDVKVERDIITVKSIDKEAASHTAANIEMATRIRAKDRRVFQDGIFLTEKDGRKI